MNNIKLSEKISDTLFITLFARANESKIENGIIKDIYAEKVVEKLKKDNIEVSFNKLSNLGSVIRSSFFDKIVNNFINKHKNPLVVNLGCGLDTRCYRTDTGVDIQIDLDLKDVIDLRKKLIINKSKRNIYWSYSILDTKWMKRLKEEYPEHNYIFIIEGVLMYLEPHDVKELFKNFTVYFKNIEIWCDTCSTIVNKMMEKKKFFKERKIKFKWAFNNYSDIENISYRLKVKYIEYYMDKFIKRWGIFYWIKFLLPFNKGSKMLGIELK